MESDSGRGVFVKTLAFGLLLNLTGHAWLGLWTSYYGAVFASVVIAIGVSAGQRLHRARR